MTKRKPKRLLFMHARGDDLGFLIFPENYYIGLTFYVARNEAGTWDEFWGSLDSICQKFVEPFMQCDDISPEPDSTIDDLIDMWIFDDREFPMTQLAEETYTEIKSYLPLELLDFELRTEYHQYIGMFPIKDYEMLRKHLLKADITVDKVTSLIPIDIRNY